MRRALPLFIVSLLSAGGLINAGCGGVDQQTGGSGGATGSSSSASSSGTGSSAGGGGAAPEFCAGTTTALYDPLSGDVTTFPDDVLTVDDATTPTKLRVHMVLGDNVNKPASGPSFDTVFKDISTLDGFGATSGITFVFSGPIDEKSLPPSGEGSGKADASLVLVNLDSAQPELIDLNWELVPEKMGDPKTTLAVRPMVPLAPKTRYGLVATTRVKDQKGGCIAPSTAQKDLLLGTASDPKLKRLAPRYTDLLKRLTDMGTIKAPQDISAAVVFTTEHTVDDSATIAGKIRKKTHPYTSAGPCTDAGTYWKCEGSFPADDFRKMQRNVDETTFDPQAMYTLKVTTCLPKVGQAPFPTIIYGHGLGGDRHQAEQLAALAAPAGYATVAIDAVKHGDHPDAPGQLGAAASFFGLSFNLMDPLDSLALRDHFRQSTYDKLQLLEMLRPGVDVDGDNKPDVGIDKLVYLGVSLGGLMSAEFLAFAPEASVAVPIVPGARVVDIIKDGATFAQVISILSGQATDGQIARFFPIVQSVVDRGDPGVYTGHIVKKRLPGFDAKTPQVLMQMVINDDTVPNSTNLFFARGLGVPHVGDELLKVGDLTHAQKLPVSGNIDAMHTGGMFQYDVVFQGMGPMTQPATHGNVAANPVAITQTLHFIDTYFKAGVSEILDPYRTLGIKP